MTKNVHCCRPEVVDDVISGQFAKTIVGYRAVNFEVASSNCFGDIKKSFRDGGGGGGHRR